MWKSLKGNYTVVEVVYHEVSSFSKHQVDVSCEGRAHLRVCGIFQNL